MASGAAVALASSSSGGVSGVSPPSAQAAHSAALQLLLRFLPGFRAAARGAWHAAQQQQAQANAHASRAKLLQANPLWRFSSLGEQQRPQLHEPPRQLLPAQAHDALLGYVRLAAAELEQQAAAAPGGRRGAQRRSGRPPSPLEVAAELHALYALAAVTAASQQQQPAGAAKRRPLPQQLSDREVLQLLGALVALDGGDGEAGRRRQRQRQPDATASSDAAAAAVQALYAFAQLAESVQQQPAQGQQVPGHNAPGQLQAAQGSAAPVGKAGGGSSSSSSSSSAKGSGVSSSHSQQELRSLLRLAQLSAHA